MRYINGTLIEPQIKTEEALKEPHGAIVCLDTTRWVLVARYTPILYLLDETHVLSSCILVLPDMYTNPVCCGAVASMDATQIYVLFCDKNGKLFIVPCFIDGDSITYHKDLIMVLPQGLKDMVLAEKTITWNQDGTTADALGIDLFPSGSTLLNYMSNFPIGPAITKYKPWITSDGTKLIIGVNHIQVMSVILKHDILFLNFDAFKDEVEKIRNVDYKENEWWTHRTITKIVQRTEVCTGEMECDQCGHKAKCNPPGTQPKNKKMRPVWDAVGNPILEEHEYTEVFANTVMTHPIMVASIVTLDAVTGLLDGITHIGASSFGSYSKRGKNSVVIVGLDSYDGTVDVFLGSFDKSVPANVLYWGNTPLFMENNALFGFYTFLSWWDTQHLPYSGISDIQQYFNIGTIVPISTTVFELVDLHVSEDLCVTQNILDYSLKPLTAPFGSITGIYDISTSLYKNISYIIYDSTILQFKIAYYEITSKYDGKIIGTRTDIAVGRVLIGIPKIIECEFKNKDTVFKMIKIHLTIVPNLLYPYYEYCMFSLDGVMWGYTINLPDLLPEESTNFYVKVHALVNNIDPKPVQFTADYRRCLV